MPYQNPENPHAPKRKLSTVDIPETMTEGFERVEEKGESYYSKLRQTPGEGSITIDGERYLLIRATALSLDLLNMIQKMYEDRGEEESLAVGRAFLFDMSHILGMTDAKTLHDKMGLVDPIEKLAAGPIHFAHTGWARVDFLSGKMPELGDNFVQLYHHDFSFEADAWGKAGRKSDTPVCIMGAGYSSGWCETSFGQPLTAVEVSCRACGDEHCTFLMASPHKIKEHLKDYMVRSLNKQNKPTTQFTVPTFLERKIIEENLRESEEKFRLVAEESPNMIFINQGGCVVYVNQKCVSLMGYTREEFYAPDFEFLSLVAPESIEIVRKNFARHMRGEEVPPYEFANITREGETIWTLMTSGLIRYEGQPALLGTLTDLTEHKAADERNIALEAQLRHGEKLQAIGQLAGGIAHDFNNRLTAIQGFAEVLAGEADNAKHREYAGRISRSAQRAAKLTSQMLAYARKGDYESIDVDIHAQIQEVILFLEHSIDKRITVDLQLNAKTPTTTADPTQIQNCLLNLALNARDAMPRGGTLTFHTCLIDEPAALPTKLKPGTYISISVSDTGMGMTPEVQTHIFEPFFTTKGPGEGSGMGLASVYGAVQTHGGAIQVESKVGAGSTFTIFLPHTTATTAVPTPHRPLEATAQKTGHILVVDDDDDARVLSEMLLNRIGYQVTLCRDGDEAVQVYREVWRKIDLVLLDMLMPRMSGRETFSHLKEINPDTQVVIVTGYGLNDEVKSVLREGAVGPLKKPFDSQALATIVATTLHGNQSTNDR